VVALGERPGVAAIFSQSLPPWAVLVAGSEEYGLKVTVLPDREHVAIQSAHVGRRLIVWELAARKILADVSVEASSPLVFADVLDERDASWAASSDTLFELGASDWQVKWSARLRNKPTGSFVDWLSVDAGGGRLFIGWQLRAVRSPDGVARPHGSEILALDTKSRRIKSLATLPGWTPSALVRDESSDVIVEAGPGQGNAVWRVATQSKRRRLFRPRPQGARDWW
jgi:hypothetical protein